MKKSFKKASNGEKTKNKPIEVIIKSVIIGLAVSMAIFFLFAFILSKKDIPFSMLNPISVLLIICASLISGYLSGRILRRNGIVIGGSCGGIIFCIIAMLSFLTSFQVGALAITKLAISVLSGVIGGICGVNAQKK